MGYFSLNSFSPLHLLNLLGHINLKDTELFQLQTKNIDHGILNFMLRNEIGIICEDKIILNNQDKMNLAVHAIKFGVSIDDVSKLLNWKNFELLSSEILKLNGYSIKTNFRFRKPKMEIDIVGTYGNFLLAIDCKHWKYNNNSMLKKFAVKQKERTKRLLNDNHYFRKGIPVLLTLYSNSIQYVENIPIVPIYYFNSFIVEFEKYTDNLLIISKDN